MKYNLVGQQFGKLTVMQEYGRRDHKILWECLCSCGKLTYVVTSRLRSGDIRSCGCLLKEINTKNHLKNIVGNKYGLLTVISLHSRKNNLIQWECRCDCGNILLVPTGRLQSKNTKSCGCLKIAKTKAMCGPRHPNWNPDISAEDREYNKKFRKSTIPEFKHWSLEIKKRDNFTCQRCQNTNCKLESHHIYSWIEYPDLRYDLNNGICLCKMCHKEFHSRFKYKQNHDKIHDFIKELDGE